MQLFEMQGLLAGQCLPGDMKVNESLAEYLLRKLEDRNELERQLSAKTISEQNIINAFGISGEGAHSKLVIEYVHGLVAERDALAKLVNAMADIGDIVMAQDNRCTSHPMFCVFQKSEMVGSEDHSPDRIAWVHDGDEVCERQSKRLEKLYQAGRETPDFDRYAMKSIDRFVTACFTEDGCKKYLEENGHNLNEPFIYVTSAFRNEEYQSARNFIVEAANLRAGSKG